MSTRRNQEKQHHQSENLTARRAALDVLTDVTSHGAYLNLRLKKVRMHLSEADARFVTALCCTTLDRLLYIDHVLKGFVNGTQKPAIRNILRMGCCELLFLSTPPYAAISENVSLCKAIGKAPLANFVNAVLRRIDRERDSLPPLPNNPVERLSTQYSCPAWIVSMWLETYGEQETAALLQANGSGLTVRAQYPYTQSELISALPCPAVHGTLDANALLLEKGFDLTNFEPFIYGQMTIQSEGAMMLCRALGDCRGKRVLDACAAPGGKSAYLASLSENNIDLTCFELHEHRLALMEKTFERLHVKANMRQQDASIHIPSFDGQFDAVLLDVPCSGLGLIHEKPDIRFAKSKEDIDALVAIQEKILETCAQYVAPNGILVYATCTISNRENEEQIQRFLSKHTEFMLDTLPFSTDSMIQLLPHIHGTDGFFAARMRRCI